MPEFIYITKNFVVVLKTVFIRLPEKLESAICVFLQSSSVPRTSSTLREFSYWLLVLLKTQSISEQQDFNHFLQLITKVFVIHRLVLENAINLLAFCTRVYKRYGRLLFINPVSALFRY